MIPVVTLDNNPVKVVKFDFHGVVLSQYQARVLLEGLKNVKVTTLYRAKVDIGYGIQVGTFRPVDIVFDSGQFYIDGWLRFGEVQTEEPETLGQKIWRFFTECRENGHYRAPE